jgi:hypothetical protein
MAPASVLIVVGPEASHPAVRHEIELFNDALRLAAAGVWKPARFIKTRREKPSHS